uniref:ShKT domain-containing protein n=1 Tax=Panagrellus redivivus TaxID=6233 RepID=A0A7E4VZT9_PANRE
MKAFCVLVLGCSAFISAVYGQSSTIAATTNGIRFSETSSSSSSEETTPSGTCVDNTADCITLNGLCTDAVYFDLMTQECARTCGRCDSSPTSGTCADIATNCADYASQCLTTTSVANACQATCKTCPGACQDASDNCVAWNLNGFCKSTFYTEAFKKTTCGVTCGLC